MALNPEALSPVAAGYATPEQVKQMRELALALQAPQKEPIRHWTQGLAEIVRAIGGNIQASRAMQLEKAGRESGSEAVIAPYAPYLKPDAGSATPGSTEDTSPSAPARGSARTSWSPEDVSAVKQTADELKIDPKTMAAVLHYETGFNPHDTTDTGKGYNVHGVIGFDPENIRKYGQPGPTIASQMPQVKQYLLDRGWKPGTYAPDDLPRLYSIINAGSLDDNGQPRWDRADKNGNLAHHVRTIQAGSMGPAERFLNSYPQNPQTPAVVAAPPGPVPAAAASPPAMPPAPTPVPFMSRTSETVPMLGSSPAPIRMAQAGSTMTDASAGSPEPVRMASANSGSFPPVTPLDNPTPVRPPNSVPIPASPAERAGALDGAGVAPKPAPDAFNQSSGWLLRALSGAVPTSIAATSPTSSPSAVGPAEPPAPPPSNPVSTPRVPTVAPDAPPSTWAPPAPVPNPTVAALTPRAPITPGAGEPAPPPGTGTTPSAPPPQFRPLVNPMGAMTRDQLQKIIANPWVPNEVKSQILNQIQERGKPQMYKVEGGELQFNPMTGESSFNPEPKYNNIEVGGNKIPVVSHYDRNTGQYRHELMLPGATGSDLTGALSGLSTMAASQAAEKKRAEETAGELAKGQAKPVVEAIEFGGRAQKALNYLNLMDQVGRTPDAAKMNTGPFAEEFLHAKQGIKDLFGVDLGGIAPAEAIEKFNGFLAAEGAKELTNRPSQFDFKTFLDRNPGIKNSPEGRQLLIDGLRQVYQQDANLANLATKVKDPSQWSDIRDKYLAEHPISLMYRGQNITSVNPSTKIPEFQGAVPPVEPLKPGKYQYIPGKGTVPVQ